MEAQLKALAAKAQSELDQAATPEKLEAWRVHYLGKSGEVTQLLRELPKLAVELRAKMGGQANQLKVQLQQLHDAKKLEQSQAELMATLNADTTDITLPSIGLQPGALHPISQVMRQLVRVFQHLGFTVKLGPEVETDYYNFAALNFPQNHPARDMQDTFFVEQGKWLLRTHTSPVQIRTMLAQKPPIRIIAPGAVYRCDADQTHSPLFHQIEGLVVDRQTSMADLKGTLNYFAQTLFGAKTQTRFRPSYFPFTEPSAEMDISCLLCNGQGGNCRVCGGSGWLEILGAGMVHPNVLEEVGYDSQQYQGFAFGMGVERIAMLLHRIPDIRLFYENAMPFLEQF